MADMDASSTIAAAETGALFNYSMIWFLLLLIIPLFIMQEVSGRLGVATEKGLGENIRERYSRKLALLLTLPMALADIATYAIEYLGIAVGLSVLGISPILSVPIVFVIHTTLVTRGNTEMQKKS
ncbi:natural resistance-associated macrophage protein [mine drainage metagenome]|uniref:Natural resistance-associated macrophage protein n=1 Tax=mine drainage metagenome TaxID=410659 RepID=T0Z9S9_9ZZZZ